MYAARNADALYHKKRLRHLIREERHRLVAERERERRRRMGDMKE